jgi:hypothetical protein
MNLLLNIDDIEPSSKFFVCDSCNTFTTFQNLDCTCGYLTTKLPKNLDSESKGNSSSTSVDGQNGVFVSENVSIFMVFDDLKIVPSSLVTSLEMLNEFGSSDLTSDLTDGLRDHLNVPYQESTFLKVPKQEST